MNAPRQNLFFLVVAQMVIFLVSLPGFGIETRTPMQYSPWAGPIFLVCTILVFLLGFLALYSFRRRRDRFRTAAGGQAVVALITNLLDISHVGGPPPPFEPLVLGLVSIGFALLALALLPWAFRG